MIIYFSNHSQNQKAIAALTQEQSQQVFDFNDLEEVNSEIYLDPNDQTLILLDLSADGKTQTLIEPSILASMLHDNGFLKNLHMIRVVISDIEPDVPMHEYVRDLQRNIFEIEPDSSVVITYIGKEQDNMSFIEPPKNISTDIWTVYALSQARSTEEDSLEKKLARYQRDTVTKTDYFDLWKKEESIILFQAKNSKSLFEQSCPVSAEIYTGYRVI